MQDQNVTVTLSREDAAAINDFIIFGLVDSDLFDHDAIPALYHLQILIDDALGIR